VNALISLAVRADGASPTRFGVALATLLGHRRFMKTIQRIVFFAALALGSFAQAAENVVLRVGHFPNITHAQALVAHNLSRQGKGWFEERLGPGTKIEWFVYNAGPSAMEAVFAQSIDLTYVGSGPALNAYTKSNGAEVRLIAGAANGGAALVVQPDQNLKAPADFRGKKIATPQLGNTQDISCRAWLIAGGLKITQLGGDAQVLPTQNPDQLQLFQQKQVDAVWTVEPWVSRLERESGGKILVDERDVATTVLVSSVKFLGAHRDLAKKFAEAHAALTDWMAKNPEEAQKLARAELLEETRSDMAPDLIAQSWKRIVFTAETPRPAVESFMQNSLKTGFIKTAPDLSKLFEKP
jgi:NitT/TauT family transport system substrate-binding protein